jgi:hypothetical protein
MSEKLRCPYCGKLVKNGRWLGTLHLCVTEGERAAIDEARWQQRQQMRYTAENLGYIGEPGYLWDKPQRPS